jgi:hypothetical protein
MADKDESKRKRMIVEEVGVKPEILEEAVKTEEPAAEPVIEPVAEPVTEPASDPVIEASPEPIIENTPEKLPEPGKQKSPIFWILIPGIFILGAILGGIFFYQKGVNQGQTATPSPEPTASTSSPTPSASPAATLDLTKYSVAILNGSGIAGEAGKVKTLITDAGFKAGSTGNAATYDYTKTIIKAKSTVEKAFIAKLSEALAKSYVVGDSQTLSASSTVDVQVIVGTSKAE